MTIKPHTKVREGRVISDKMDKTVVVAVESRYRHPLYKKIMRRTRNFKAHNENNEAKAGDAVRIVETRPLSKEKRWRVAQILTKGEVVELPTQVVEAPPVEKTEPVAQQPAPKAAEAAAPAEATQQETKSPAEGAAPGQ